MDAGQWREYFGRHRIDCLKIVPSHLSALLGRGEGDAQMLPREVLVLGGEASALGACGANRADGACLANL